MVIEISFVMAAYNTAPYIAEAIKSVLSQSVTAIELIVVDDGSSDETLQIANGLAASDSRVVVIEAGPQSGPAATRNRAIAVARGEWIAIVDSDDLILPDRSRELLDLAMVSGSDIIADNIARFSDSGGKALPTLFAPGKTSYSFMVDAPAYLRCNTFLGSTINLGYLKPMFRRAFLLEHQLTYSESIRIGEDFEFCLACLLNGARFLVTSRSWYRYRIRNGSLSWRLKSSDVELMMTAHDAMMRRVGDGQGPEFSSAAEIYSNSLRRSHSFFSLIEALNERRFGEAISIVWQRVDLLVPLAKSVYEKTARRFERVQQARDFG